MLLLPVWGSAQSDAYTVKRVLQRYTEAYGGFLDVDALSSLSVEGQIEQDGQTFDFLMRKKRPYSLRYRLSNDWSRVISGYNGKDGWLRVETNGEVTIQSLDSDAEASLRELARFDSPLFRALEKRENEISLADQIILDERSVYVLAVREFGRAACNYYIDAVTAHILRIDQFDGDGEIQFQTFYRDYKEIEGYPFAHEVETRVNGETISLAKVHVIEVNPGLLSFYFEKPKH
ncbi:hypothetical protein ACWPKS_03975 [Coraliomargarita sp. W4R72]